MKKILIGLVVLLVVLAAVLFFALDAIVGGGIKTAVNTFGPGVTETDVTLENADVSVFSGEGTLETLHVGNPDGYDKEKALSFGKISLKLDTGSLLSDKIIVERVVIEEPEFVLEQALSGNNLTALLENIKKNTGGDKPKEDTEGGKKVVIKQVIVKGGKLDASLFGVGSAITVPDMTLESESDEGVTASNAIGQVLDQVLSSVIASLPELLEGLGGDAEKLAKNAVQDLQGLSDKALDEITKAGDDIGKEAGKLGEEAGKAVDDAKDKLKGLFGD